MEEFVDLVDENGNELGIKKEKSRVHLDGDWHKGAHVWILSGNKILLQRRTSRKEFFPDCFDVSCGGHVKSGETFEETIVRELKEELGLSVKKEDLLFLEKRRQISLVKSKSLISREILGVFLLRLDVNLKNLDIDKNEISEVKLFDIDELKNLLKYKPEMFVADKKYFFETINKIEKIIKS
jgi:isopentenyldiphosphate isomerase